MRNSSEASSNESCTFCRLCDVCSELNAFYVCGTTLTCIDEAQIQGNPPKQSKPSVRRGILTSCNYTIHSEKSTRQKYNERTSECHECGAASFNKQ